MVVYQKVSFFNMSLDHLIKLARRTGDRLIVHDSSGEKDLVIMDIDSYEQLLDLQTMSDERDFFAPEPWERDDLSDDLSADEPETGASPWHSAADVFRGAFEMAHDQEIKIEDIPFGSDSSPASASSWRDEPLAEEEPVFYEEPV